MNKRGCYCELWDKNPAYFEERGVPRGYCGFCETCEKPGHIRHFPGGVPYTGCWCDFHYRRLSLVHPLGSLGSMLYAGLVVLMILIVMFGFSE